MPIIFEKINTHCEMFFLVLQKAGNTRKKLFCTKLNECVNYLKITFLKLKVFAQTTS